MVLARGVVVVGGGCWRSRWCGACRVLGQPWASAGAAVFVCRTVGVASWGPRELWLARGLGQVTATGGSLPDLAVPHLSVIHVWAHPVRPAGRTHKRAALAAAGRASTPGNCAPCSLTEGLPDCPQAVSRAPGRRQRAQGSPTRPRQPGTAAAGHPPAPSPSPAAPEKERLHPRGLQRQAPATSHTDRQILSTPQEAQTPGRGPAPHPTTHTPTPKANQPRGASHTTRNSSQCRRNFFVNL